MGLYDVVTIATVCPVCKMFHAIEFQTKDLGRKMYHYRALSEDWFSNNEERKLRQRLPVFPQTPYDKSHKVWKNQAEKIEAMAKIPSEEEFGKLKYINVIGYCNNKWIRAKLPIRKGFIVGELMDVKTKKV